MPYQAQTKEDGWKGKKKTKKNPKPQQKDSKRGNITWLQIATHSKLFQEVLKEKMLFCRQAYVQNQNVFLSCKSSYSVPVSFTKLFEGDLNAQPYFPDSVIWSWFPSISLVTMLLYFSLQWHFVSQPTEWPRDNWQASLRKRIPDSEIGKQTTQMSARAGRHYVLPSVMILEEDWLSI